MTLTDFLAAHGLDHLADLFAANEVDLETLRLLSEDDLKELGLAFGPRKKILAALRQPEPELAPAAAEPAAAERRQLTVMFADMVGFTEVAHRVDPEELKAIIATYEERCTAAITAQGGYLFTTLGDGIVAFFGYPAAHEDEAARAIRAGLAILDSLKGLEVPGGGPFQVRIGIATGIVVVAPGERNAVGETMNLAARLQALAEPDTLIITDRVRRNAGGQFLTTALGPHHIKGIDEVKLLYRVDGRAEADSRFAAAGRETLPLVGRRHEVELILDRWHHVRAEGIGHAVLLGGEAGIGKSRILAAVREAAEADGVHPLLFQCQPHQTHTAFHPIVAAFGRLLGYAADLGGAERLDRLLAFTRLTGIPPDDARFLAAMLSLPFEDRLGGIAVAPKRAKAETIRVLGDCLAAIAGWAPTHLLFEDAHWADPSTVEVLAGLIDRLDRLPVLLIATHRPEFVHPWPGHSHVTTLTLSRLTARQSASLVETVAGGATIPRDLADRIVARSDGVPLFVEELTRSILESGELVLEGGRYAYAADAVTIPDSLRDSLTARLDRAGEGKAVAQIGAVIGRDFPFALLSGLAALPEPALLAALDRLTASGLVQARGHPPESTYVFKHALLQDVAYDGLLKSERRQLHGRLARLIATHRPDAPDTEPELLAHHFHEAGEHAEAVPLWRRAGERAMQRFAIREAHHHLDIGLKGIAAIPPGPERDADELALRSLLGPAAVALKGWGHPDVAKTLEPAWTLAQRLDRHAAYVPILNALWVHHMCAGRLAESQQWADRLLETGDALHDDSLAIVGHRAASGTAFWLGDFAAARRHGDQVHALYDPVRHHPLAQLTNTDPVTGEAIYRAQYLWLLGEPDSALHATRANHAHARQRNHPFDLAFSLTLGAQAHELRREPEPLLLCTEEAERIGREHGVPLLSDIMAEISRGLVLIHGHHLAEGAAQLDRGVSRLWATGHRVWIGYLRCVEANARARLGEWETAARLMDREIMRLRDGEERAHFPEMLRLRAGLHAEAGDTAAAETLLREALALARAQHALGWELRIALALARLAAPHDPAAARAILAPVHARFREGHDTADLQDAARFLASLPTTAQQKEIAA
jgi:class 3 adenylate cyclase